jgi:hypothetical protein
MIRRSFSDAEVWCEMANIVGGSARRRFLVVRARWSEVTVTEGWSMPMGTLNRYFELFVVPNYRGFTAAEASESAAFQEMNGDELEGENASGGNERGRASLSRGRCECPMSRRRIGPHGVHAASMGSTARADPSGLFASSWANGSCRPAPSTQRWGMPTLSSPSAMRSRKPARYSNPEARTVPSSNGYLDRALSHWQPTRTSGSATRPL